MAYVAKKVWRPRYGGLIQGEAYLKGAHLSL